MLFSVPRRGEDDRVLSGPILREGLLRFTVAVTYYDKDGNVLLTWDGPGGAVVGGGLDMRLRNKTARNLLLRAILVALGAGLLLSPGLSCGSGCGGRPPGRKYCGQAACPWRPTTVRLLADGAAHPVRRDGDELLSCT